MKMLCTAGVVWWIAISHEALASGSFDCPNNPNALGTSRVLVVNTDDHPRLGSMQYDETLPLADKEIVLTFDDGPRPPYTDQILDILASECIKATFFIIGSNAQQHPEEVRRIQREGHTIGTHSQNHPLIFNRMPIARAQLEIENGIASTAAALNNPATVAPFFRIPGLARAAPVELYLQERGLVLWSADFLADDWKRRITSQQVLEPSPPEN